MFLSANLGGVGAIGAGEMFWGQNENTNAWGFDLAPSTNVGTEIINEAGTGMNQFDWARSLVDRDYCARVACGAVQQSEAGADKLRACGIAYPMQTQAWCSDFCAPYSDELHARYTFACGVQPGPQPAPPPVTQPLPSITRPAEPLVFNELPDVIKPKPAILDPGTCPDCATACYVQVGNCCLTDLQILALLGLVTLAVVT